MFFFFFWLFACLLRGFVEVGVGWVLFGFGFFGVWSFLVVFFFGLLF